MKISKQRAIVYIGLFLVLLLGFMTFSTPINTSYARFIVPLIGIVLLSMHAQKYGRIVINKSLFITWCCLVLPVLYKNYDIYNGNLINVVYYVLFFCLAIIMSKISDWYSEMWKVLVGFTGFHFMAGVFLLMNKEILLSRVLPMLNLTTNGYNLLMNCIKNGYMTGLCNHYSVMGVFMAIGVIAASGCTFSYNYLKKKVELIIFLVFVIGLVMTGKRGVLVFSLSAIFIVNRMFSERKLTNSQLKRIIGTGVLFLMVFVVAYYKIPQVKSIIFRFTENTENLNDMSTGRVELFWVNALTMFKNRPLLGNGWRSFRRQIVSVFGNSNPNDAHNIYLQLLAETGIVGSFLVIYFMFKTMMITYKGIKIAILSDENSKRITIPLKQSLTFQLFFVLYGLTGNPLYDMNCYLPYLMSCVMAWSYYVGHKSRFNR